MNKILQQLTIDEKITLLTGVASMETAGVSRLNIKGKRLSDGPHGVRIKNRDYKDEKQNCTMFPNMCCLGATWDVELIERVGEALGKECSYRGIDMLLAPGINIKRNIVCGRNFEYVSEDPYVSGEIGAAYINGLQKAGVSASLKHFAANNQEKYRSTSSSEIDERTMREIYLKGFEIAVKKSRPESVMCAFNKLNSIWCAENKMLLTDILRDEWGYEGFVVSDWNAVEDVVKSLKAGLDLQMPANKNLYAEIKEAYEQGVVSEEEIDTVARRILHFILKEKAPTPQYDRNAQHECAREAAAAGTVLLKNNNKTLPITSDKYKKITVVGEFADRPLISGMGSAEVYPDIEYIDSPVAELKKRLPDVEIQYREYFRKSELPTTMLWPKIGEYKNLIADSDAVIIFIGSHESEDTEYFDRRNVYFNPNYEMFIEEAHRAGKKTIVVMQSGSAMILGDWNDYADSILQMWLGGEAAGSAIADILCGNVNPSGRLSETFPNCMRTDIEYPGNGEVVRYKEGFEVGYRYYDMHTDEICYPFGHGLSYTDFKYELENVEEKDETVKISVKLTNSGMVDGAEVMQIYVNDPVSTVSKPIKELKAFKKVFIKQGESKTVVVEIQKSDLAYYNIMLREWIVEDGEYRFLIGSSSQDIRLDASVTITGKTPYTMHGDGITLLG